MPNPRSTSHLAIPESLRLQLADFRRRLWRVKIIEALAAGLIGLLVSFLLVYGLDRFVATPAWARLLILISGVSLFAGFAPYWLHRWVWRQRRQTQIAQLIAKHYPGLGDRLLGVIELQNQEANQDTLSPRLREAAMLAVAAETQTRPLRMALPPPRHRKWASGALGLMLIVTIVLVATPQAGLNALQRWIMPLSDTARYTFTTLDNPPTFLAVPFGESFGVNLTLSHHSKQHPATAIGRYGLQPEVATRLTNDAYRFTFPGQQDPGVIEFRVGDLRHKLIVEPLQRPSVEQVWATLTAPDYLQSPPRKINLLTGSLSAVQGSQLQIELTMNRPLAATSSYGPIEYSNNEAPGAAPFTPAPEKNSQEAPAAQASQTALIVSERQAKTATLDVSDMDFEIPFAWQDRHGLSGDSGFRIRVDAIKDAAPNCYLQGIKRMHLMLPEETIDFELLAEDDFSVHSSGIQWDGQFTQPSDGSPAQGELQLAAGSPEKDHLLNPVAFCPAAFGITPQKITLRGWAKDYLPNRERVYSEPVTIYVLTRNEHAQILKNRFERQITELEDLARRELNLLEENQRIERLDGNELQNESGSKRLSKQQREEDETKRRTDDLTERIEQVLKDAARNGDIDKETLRKIAEALKSMQELSTQDIPNLQQQLGEANQPSNSPEKSEKDISEAVQQQMDVVAKMQQAISKANDANQHFEAGTFVKRLKKAAAEQLRITQSLIEAFLRTPNDSLLGQFAEEVDPSDLTRLNRNINQQSATATDVRWIQEDLTHYYARTQMAAFKEILDEMKGADVNIHLEKIRSFLSSNKSFMAASQSKQWADQLNAWAKKLEGDQNNNGGGGGGSGGGASENEDFEFMLRVMKMIQTQQDLRARTRALEQLRRDHQNATAN